MLAWLIINTILLIATILVATLAAMLAAALVGITCVTIQWFRAEKKLAKFGQSTLYTRVKNNKLYKKCENFFEKHADDNE